MMAVYNNISTITTTFRQGLVSVMRAYIIYGGCVGRARVVL